MSVLIKGMGKVPDSCWECPLMGNLVCGWDRKIISETKRKDECPLVALPEKHGDLIDRQTLKNAVLKWLPHDPCGDEYKERPFETDICVSMMMEIEEQDAVIEAEGEG